MRRIQLLQSVVLVLAVGLSAEAGVVIEWNASSGSMPDQISTPWTLVDTATPENPTLANGVLTLSTSEASENMRYIQSGALVDTASPFFIEARLRYVSGSTTSTARAPVTIILSTAPGIGNTLFIDRDEVFFNTDSQTAGKKVSVDTDDAFHTYRINYDGAGGLELFHNGISILTGSTFNNSSFNGSQQRISWGEASNIASGTSEWVSFRHNAGVTAVPEPTSLVLFSFGGFIVLSPRYRRRHAGHCS